MINDNVTITLNRRQAIELLSSIQVDYDDARRILISSMREGDLLMEDIARDEISRCLQFISLLESALSLPSSLEL